MTKQFELPFEKKYNYHYSKIYYLRHKKGFLKLLSNSLEQRMIAKALRLAGSPKVVLDIPCGAGRFFNTILNSGTQNMIAADQSPDMLQVIQEVFPTSTLNNIKLMQTSITQIDLPDQSVDTALCIRLIHHIHDKAYRDIIYKELRRVARQTVCISYWVDGNYKSHREALRAKKTRTLSRCLNRTELEQELTSAGFSIIDKVDMCKFLSYWRTYILKI